MKERKWAGRRMRMEEIATSRVPDLSRCCSTERTCFAQSLGPWGSDQVELLQKRLLIMTSPLLLFLSFFLSCQTNMMDGVISVSQKHERLSGVLWCPTAWISCLVLWWCAWNPDELTYCSSHSIQHGGPLNTLHIRFNTCFDSERVLLYTFKSDSPQRNGKSYSPYHKK